MRKKIFKTLLFVLILAIGVSTAVINLNALMDNACRGTDICDAVHDACFAQFEVGFAFRMGALCDGEDNCITYFRVLCVDDDEELAYNTYVHCNSPADYGECKSR